MNNGKEAEIIAILNYTRRGYEIFTPLSGGSCDFIAVKDLKILKVEVKSTKSASGKIELRRRFYKTKQKYKVKSDTTFLINLISGNYKIVESSSIDGRTCITVK